MKLYKGCFLPALMDNSGLSQRLTLCKSHNGVFVVLIICLLVFWRPFLLWLLTLCVIQLTPDVRQLHGKGLRPLHDMDTMWPRPLAGRPAVVRRDMLPRFVSVNPL